MRNQLGFGQMKKEFPMRLMRSLHKEYFLQWGHLESLRDCSIRPGNLYVCVIDLGRKAEMEYSRAITLVAMATDNMQDRFEAPLANSHPSSNRIPVGFFTNQATFQVAAVRFCLVSKNSGPATNILSHHVN